MLAVTCWALLCHAPNFSGFSWLQSPPQLPPPPACMRESCWAIWSFFKGPENSSSRLPSHLPTLYFLASASEMSLRTLKFCQVIAVFFHNHSSVKGWGAGELMAWVPVWVQETNVSAWKQRELSPLHYLLFYSGLQGIGWRPPTLGRAICFALSADTNVHCPPEIPFQIPRIMLDQISERPMFQPNWHIKLTIKLTKLQMLPLYWVPRIYPSPLLSSWPLILP